MTSTELLSTYFLWRVLTIPGSGLTMSASVQLSVRPVLAAPAPVLSTPDTGVRHQWEIRRLLTRGVRGEWFIGFKLRVKLSSSHEVLLKLEIKLIEINSDNLSAFLPQDQRGKIHRKLLRFPFKFCFFCVWWLSADADCYKIETFPPPSCSRSNFSFLGLG